MGIGHRPRNHILMRFVDFVGSLLSSGAIMRWVGKSGIEAISRLMGFLLVCMGVQFIINGVLELISTYQPVMA